MACMTQIWSLNYRIFRKMSMQFILVNWILLAEVIL
jgi:hypothetical protein